ncbi:MAG: DUF3039 domain-containing protein [Actinobacteria bacterium]|nr:DUF3039 domain-containing protein [Actinomycetota bacterium]
MTATIVSPQVADPIVDHEPPKVAHVIARENHSDADTLVTAAYIEGTPLEALCGQVFVPSRDPNGLPPCERCMEIVAEILRLREELG